MLTVLVVYLVLCYSAAFRFHPKEIYDVYSLNFKSYHVHAIGLFLSMFPVFTLSANFPLIAITLRENLKTLFAKQRTAPHSEAIRSEHSPSRGVRGFLQQHVYAGMAITPPIIIALCTENVSMLVGFTGAYAGLGIQWIIPAILVQKLRTRLTEVGLKPSDSMHQSPFASPAWVKLTLGMALVALVVVTATHIFG